MTSWEAPEFATVESRRDAFMHPLAGLTSLGRSPLRMGPGAMYSEKWHSGEGRLGL
jgi:hypothetical protein